MKDKRDFLLALHSPVQMNELLAINQTKYIIGVALFTTKQTQVGSVVKWVFIWALLSRPNTFPNTVRTVELYTTNNTVHKCITQNKN